MQATQTAALARSLYQTHGDKAELEATQRERHFKEAGNDVELLPNGSRPPSSNPVLSIDELDLSTPDKRRVLIQNLSMKLMEGETLVGVVGAIYRRTANHFGPRFLTII